MVTFRIEGIPPSYNKHFHVNYNFRQVYLSPEAREFKKRVKFSVPFIETSTASRYHMEIAYHSNFKYKNGKNRKIDIQNMDKLLIDAVFEQLGIDDSYLFSIQQMKVQDKDSYTVVTLREI